MLPRCERWLEKETLSSFQQMEAQQVHRAVIHTTAPLVTRVPDDPASPAYKTVRSLSGTAPDRVCAFLYDRRSQKYLNRSLAEAGMPAHKIISYPGPAPASELRDLRNRYAAFVHQTGYEPLDDP